MNPSGSGRGRGRGRGRGQHAWKKLPSDFQTPVRGGASTDGPMSGSHGRNPQSPWQVKDHYSDGGVSRNNEIATPAGRHGQQQGCSASSGPSSLDRKPHISWQVKGNNCSHGRNPQSPWQVKDHYSDGGVSRNNEIATPAGCHGQQQGCSVSSGPSSLDRKPHISWQVKGNNLDSVVSQNNDNVTSGGHQGVQQGSSPLRGDSNFRGARTEQWRVIEAKVPINNVHSVLESADYLADVSRLSLESAVESGNFNSGANVIKSTENEHDLGSKEHSGSFTASEVIDICPPKAGSVFKLNPPLLAMNREKRNEIKIPIDGLKGTILGSGMVLLQSYISKTEQAQILKICRNHGVGSAGFYQPSFRDGGELHMKMMCFGKFWDPETNSYGKVRPKDHAKPPPVPREFLVLVDRAIKDSHSLITEHSKVKNVEDVLPSVKPDICLVNYYATTGRLGLHQDKDESRESIRKGIPVVSFSIGDTADFLYGDQVDVEKSKKIELKSGDVLIFGGASRNIFHGVSMIQPKTAPPSLLQETNFLPGRLNLTFRQQCFY